MERDSSGSGDCGLLACREEGVAGERRQGNAAGGKKREKKMRGRGSQEATVRNPGLGNDKDECFQENEYESHLFIYLFIYFRCLELRHVLSSVRG